MEERDPVSRAKNDLIGPAGLKSCCSAAECDPGNGPAGAVPGGPPDRGLFPCTPEERREQSLILQSGRLLVSFLLLSAVYLLGIFVFKNVAAVPSKLLLLVSMAPFAPLAAGIVLVLTAQWRSGRDGPPDSGNSPAGDPVRPEANPETSGRTVPSGPLPAPAGQAQQDKKRRSDLRAGLIRAAMICCMVSLGLASVTYFILALIFA